ncbi:3-deoxy-7-phosphoheptulonate synthase [Kibdelosporangium phytohabitans]|uniref:Phospho-2-dehydro-3-deoxyheptonate aldolase n=1 Tax=Kibdelosporangium phytohabitans TaxID=860235 RepID=A0A0N9I452_9PSEU|nr:3-deoxy-7-phosphoheptulonate synthase [Kibdelosporangium phytohabitans]ALG09307.1 phospho-2-dehydro-3-deoxyheptonate aldolase [Kibdelosporangium phytohabitans]MBE1469438.1 3-deoxy-7-phosphoheptulonate synthase [Kibdelosporangium phytohabitans]
MDNVVPEIVRATAAQQPVWHDHARLDWVRTELASRPALVRAADVDRLRSILARVAAGQAHVVQAGDCAEDPADRTAGYVARKTALLDLLAGTLKLITSKPVVRAGRIAGQFTKPRSVGTQLVGGVELPVYRGHMVNSPEPDPLSRRPAPERILDCYQAASDVMGHLGWLDGSVLSGVDAPVWTSHEALLLDYEIPMIRQDWTGRPVLASTHWPWIGNRTRQIDGAHVALLAQVRNPLSCKVDANITVGELLELCERLDPGREPGRLTLISRMGATAVAGRLPALAAAVRAAGHPVVWLCDPMHGNTIRTPDGLKTRLMDAMLREVDDFQSAIAAGGGVAGGLHLETTPENVTECVANESELDRVGDKYTSLCDPRLTPEQAVAVVSAWRG